ncbi:unnamed protein product [Arabidopsis halleri]
MLGALPSSYLKMGLKESSCSDSEYWAKLEDDVYKDRNLQRKSFMEISERFGWDNEDKNWLTQNKFRAFGDK